MGAGRTYGGPAWLGLLLPYKTIRLKLVYLSGAGVGFPNCHVYYTSSRDRQEGSRGAPDVLAVI